MLPETFLARISQWGGRVFREKSFSATINSSVNRVTLTDVYGFVPMSYCYLIVQAQIVSRYGTNCGVMVATFQGRGTIDGYFVSLDVDPLIDGFTTNQSYVITPSSASIMKTGSSTFQVALICSCGDGNTTAALDSSREPVCKAYGIFQY
ncbi:MAG: hypothetical protein NC218_02475 [Acetobacter sp.]|nr:hypothetical protein [Acetobacter sp.]